MKNSQQRGSEESRELYQLEVTEGGEDAIVIDGGSDVVGSLFEGVDGVAHSDADACGKDH